MFDRFVRGAQARQALRDGRFEEALDLSRDPLLRDERRTTALRDAAIEGLLDRAARHLDGDAVDAARRDLEVARTHRPEDERARELRERVETWLAARSDRQQRSAEVLAEVRTRLEEGDLTAGREGLETARQLGVAAHDLEAVETLLRSREARAEQLMDEVRKALGRRGDIGAGVRALAEARALDRDRVEYADLGRRLAAARGGDVAAELERIARQDGFAAALDGLRQSCAEHPELAAEEAVREALRGLQRGQADQARAQLEAGEIGRALQTLQAGSSAQTSTVLPEAAWAERLGRALEDERRGAFDTAASVWEAAGRELRLSALRERATELRAAATEIERLLADAREAAASGRLLEARRLLVPVLTDHPEHEGVRAELEALHAVESDRGERLAAVRELVRERKLAAARTAALTLVTSGPEGDPARALVTELEARMATVRSGLDQVLRDLHGRNSAGRDGLVHCVRRLEQLATEQVDEPELIRTRVAVEAELRGVDLLVSARDALAAGLVDDLEERVAGLAGLRDELLTPERLAARSQELADKIADRADTELRGGLVARAQRFARLGGQLATICPAVAARIERCDAAARAAAAKASEHAADGQRALHRRDPEAARRALETARGVGCDVPAVLALERALRGVRRDENILDEVEELARRSDPAAAARHLAAIGPTPAPLRTRIFDLRRDLAQAQGLGSAFLLRVDEAGEFLVVRSDSWTIGNLRDGSADIPVLAQLAGVHARFVRSMSFHGGQVDKVVAERGELRVGDSRERSAKRDESALQPGQRLHLGDTVSVRYDRPSERSLTAELRLLGGFQVAGTERILWFKDRGRDGRVLLGPGEDAHVRLPGATGEVELFSDRDGGLRVRVPGRGRVDGEAFHGEHAMLPGVWVEASGVSFTVLPWSAR